MPLTRRAAALGLLPAACAPRVQVAGAPGLGFGGPRLEDGPEPAFIAHDGTRLGLTIWAARTPEPQGARRTETAGALHGAG